VTRDTADAIAAAATTATDTAGNTAAPKGERILNIGGLRTTAVGNPDAPLTLVLLHGYAMEPADLAPFAHSIGIPAYFLLPQGPVASPNGGHAWWEVDLGARESALAVGPRDLATDNPRGLPAARQEFGQFLAAVTAEAKPYRTTSRRTSPTTVIGGFSQGGMLALDWVLRGNQPVDGLALLSTSRLAISDWLPQRERLRDLPVFLSHGANDRDLGFAAGERLRDFLLESAAQLTWTPFDGGHEIPLVVWRGLRKFLTGLLK
jgi:phospholipase/carboxylesterase